MKTITKALILSFFAGLLFTLDVPPEFPMEVGFVPEAEAVFGVRRRAARRGVIVGSSMAATSAAASNAAATTVPAVAPAQPAPTPAPVAAPASDGKALPIGSVVSSLPSGCKTHAVGGIQYYQCGQNFYRAVFQGNNLVYVTAKP